MGIVSLQNRSESIPMGTYSWKYKFAATPVVYFIPYPIQGIKTYVQILLFLSFLYLTIHVLHAWLVICSPWGLKWDCAERILGKFVLLRGSHTCIHPTWKWHLCIPHAKHDFLAQTLGNNIFYMVNASWIDMCYELYRLLIIQGQSFIVSNRYINLLCSNNAKQTPHDRISFRALLSLYEQKTYCLNGSTKRHIQWPYCKQMETVCPSIMIL